MDFLLSRGIDVFRFGPSYGSIQGGQQAAYQSDFTCRWELHEPDGSNGRPRSTFVSNSHIPKRVIFYADPQTVSRHGACRAVFGSICATPKFRTDVPG